MEDKRGESILTGNLVFIILNLVFLAILVVFLVSKMGSVAVLEEKYAKQIVMIIDSAEPQMEVHLEMEDAFKKKDKGVDKDSIVSVNENIVNVNLREGGKGYSYSFFNDVDVNVYAGKATGELNKYIIMVNKK